MQLDFAVAFGALLGLVSAVLMTLLEAPFWGKFGIDGAVEWQVNQVMISWMLNEKYDPRRHLKGAVAMHLFHGAVIGAVTAGILSLAPPLSWYAYVVAAEAASVALWAAAPFGLRSVFERAIGARFSSHGLLISFAGHLAYGTALGVTVAWVLRLA